MENKYLIVVDMQKDFIDGALGSPDAKAIVENVCEKIKNYKGYVILTQDTHKEEEYANTLEGKLLPVPHCLINRNGESDGHKLNEDIVTAVKEQVLNLDDAAKNAELKSGTVLLKPTFGSITLATTIGWANRGGKQIDEIEVCGLCTDICVVSNALLLRAWFPDVPMKVDAKCCAGTTKERHDAALATMKSCQIEVINE